MGEGEGRENFRSWCRRSCVTVQVRANSYLLLITKKDRIRTFN